MPGILVLSERPTIGLPATPSPCETVISFVVPVIVLYNGLSPDRASMPEPDEVLRLSSHVVGKIVTICHAPLRYT